MNSLLFALLVLLILPVAALVRTILVTLQLQERIRRLEARLEDLLDTMARIPGAGLPTAGPPAASARPEPAVPPTPAVPSGPLPPGRTPAVTPPDSGGHPAGGRASAAAGSEPERRSLEQEIGTRWMVWVGAVILVLGIGFFLKYAFENAWIGPTGRVAMGILSGVAMVAAAEAARRRDYRFLGQGLAGGGVAALYVSIFAASGFYQLVPSEAAFLLMMLVTAGGISLAVLQDALAIAVLSTLGGLLTPVLLSTGQDSAEVLFAYLGILDLGVLGAAFYRRWRALDLLAYAGTMLLYAGWYESFYRPDRMGVALAGLLGFFVLFLIIPVVPALRRRVSSPPEAVLLPAVAGLAAFGFAYVILSSEHRAGLAFLTLLLSAGYLAVGVLIRSRSPSEGRLISGHLVLAVAFLTLAVPIKLGLHGITLAWAVEGPVLILLGFHYRERLVRLGGVAALGCAALRVLVYHYPLHQQLFRPLLNRPFGTVLFVVLAFGAAAWIWLRHQEGSGAKSLASPLAVLGGALLVILLSAETEAYCRLTGSALLQEETYRSLSRTLLLVLWGSAGLVFLLAGLRRGSALSRAAAAGLFLLAGFQAAGGISPAWSPGSASPPANLGFLFLNPTFLSSLFVVACFVAGAKCYRSTPPGRDSWDGQMPKLLSGAALLELWLILSLEVYRYFSTPAPAEEMGQRSAWLAQMAVTVTWTLYALALLAAGFILARPALRYTAFALFGVSVLKALLVDMAEVRQIYRVVSLVGLGLVLVGVSYLYSRIAVRLREATTGK